MFSFMGSDNEKAPAVYASCLLPLAGGDAASAALLAVVGTQHFWQPCAMAEAALPAVRGPLYPPIDAFVYYPLALLPPQVAYRVMQCAVIGFALLAALGIRQLSRR